MSCNHKNHKDQPKHNTAPESSQSPRECPQPFLAKQHYITETDTEYLCCSSPFCTNRKESLMCKEPVLLRVCEQGPGSPYCYLLITPLPSPFPSHCPSLSIKAAGRLSSSAGQILPKDVLKWASTFEDFSGPGKLYLRT